MWQMHYLRALEIVEERQREAARERLVRTGSVAHPHSSWIDGLRRRGAIFAAGIARRLDECVARETLGQSRDDGLTATG